MAGRRARVDDMTDVFVRRSTPSTQKQSLCALPPGDWRCTSVKRENIPSSTIEDLVDDRFVHNNSTMVIRYAALSLLLALAAEGFTSPSLLNRAFVSTTPKTVPTAYYLSPLFQQKSESGDGESKTSRLRRFLGRFDRDSTAVLPDAENAGIGQKIKSLHNPITYIVLCLALGAKTNCWGNPFYWFLSGFCIKWYRARYVFKIPVWDRQPNWNNVITSKEQEKDLKAFTCKNCGSTIFIAKTREFFFEGETGIGGLGCFACGAKGADNFSMDRERIVEDVADIDDYFEYERPLDFVTSAERKKLLKEAGGDEEKANQFLVVKANGDTVTQPTDADKTESDDEASAESQEPEKTDSPHDEASAESQEPEKTDSPQASEGDALAPEVVDAKPEAVSVDSATGEEEQVKPKKKKKKKAKEPEAKKVDLPPPSSDDGLDDLGMDDF